MGIHVLPTRHYEIFKDLQQLAQSLQQEGRGLNAPVNIRTLERLSPRMVVVKPEERRRNYRILFSGDLINEAYGRKFDGLTFREIRHSPVPDQNSKQLRQCQQGWSDVVSAQTPLLTKQKISFGPQKNTDFFRLIIPILKNDKVTQLIAAIAFEQDP